MNQPFGIYISDLRKARNISLADVATGSGISEGELKKLESGKIYASKEQVFRMASYFNMAEREFLRLNQQNRIHFETSHHIPGGSSPKYQSITAGSNGSYTRRIENLQRDLDVLDAHALNIRLHIPVQELRPLIDSIVYCKGHALGYPFEKTLPDGSSQLQIVIGDGGREVIHPTGKRIHLHKAWVMGINSVPVTYRLLDVQGVIYVRFRPNGLHAFTKIHQKELSNSVVDASVVFGADINDLWDRLASCDDPAQMIRQVEGFFLKRLPHAVVVPPMVAYLLDHIQSPLTQLASETGYTSRYLTKTFQKFIGVGPKTLQRIRRFHSVVSELNHLPGKLDWSDIVFQHGYHDQAHFIKEFRDFSGLSPQNYVALGQSCPRYLHTSQ